MSFNIYEVSQDGTARWTYCEHTALSARGALELAHKKSVFVVTGKKYFVVDPQRNPQGQQCLFRLEQTEVVARPVGL